MIFVEHTSPRNYPSFVWGKDIRVSVAPDELEVSAVIPVLQQDSATAPDALRAYRRAVTRFGAQKRQGKNSPHIRFANADDDQKLIGFVQQFGPVVVSSLRSEERTISPQDSFDFTTRQTVLVAHQDLAELREERRVYRAALILMSELQVKKPDVQTIQDCIVEIVDRVNRWPRQWKRERQLRNTGQGYASQPQWNFGEENLRHLEILSWEATRKTSDDALENSLRTKPARAGHYVMCELVNAFSPLVYPWGNTPIEAPHWDLTAGIRPILYYILRREYLQTGAIGICRNIECRELFEIERFGQQFCTDVCSRLQRQREYWQKVGRKLRQRRAKVRKSAAIRQPSRTSAYKADPKTGVR